jgi:tRNA nucleotidyltransferase (CCA-adding enzyme)
MEVYLVGGAVRDELLGVTPRERDWVVVGATAQEMEARGFRRVGRDFPVFLHPESGEEYALARTERKSGHGYHGFVVHAEPDVTLEEDLARRDLTINAIARSPDGDLIDPFRGEEDLRQGRLRHVSAAFSEDPVRILRVARFAARFARWGFRVAHTTQSLMRAMVESGEVDHLVAERVWKEMERALGEERPRRFFEVLQRCGALARILPELDALFPEMAGHQDRDAVHASPADLALAALDAAVELSPSTEVRFAALLYQTVANLDNAGRQQRLKGLCKRLRTPGRHATLARQIACFHPLHAALPSVTAAEVVELLGALDGWRQPGNLPDFIDTSTAIDRAIGSLAGRGGASLSAESPGRLLLELHQAAAAASGAELAARGLSGSSLGEALRLERIARVEAHLQACHTGQQRGEEG